MTLKKITLLGCAALFVTVIAGASLSTAQIGVGNVVATITGSLPAGTNTIGNVGVNNVPVGTATIATGQYSNATASATQVVGARAGASGTGRISVTLYNTGLVSIFVGASGVTTATGIPILPGGSFTLYTTAAVFGVPASGTGALAYLETY